MNQKVSCHLTYVLNCNVSSLGLPLDAVFEVVPYRTLQNAFSRVECIFFISNIYLRMRNRSLQLVSLNEKEKAES